MPRDQDFDAVPAGSLTDNACSPRIEDDPRFRGIRIAAPQKVALEGKPDEYGYFARVIICGAYQLDSNYLGLRERFLPRVLIVAVDLKRHLAFAGRAHTLLNAEMGPDPFQGEMLNDREWKGRFITEFFNPNLVAELGLPREEADYAVYAALGKYVSNVVRIAVRR
jgi:hypothetical protein